jgi:hypothetical protein
MTDPGSPKTYGNGKPTDPNLEPQHCFLGITDPGPPPTLEGVERTELTVMIVQVNFNIFS